MTSVNYRKVVPCIMRPPYSSTLLQTLGVLNIYSVFASGKREDRKIIFCIQYNVTLRNEKNKIFNGKGDKLFQP